MHWGDALAAKDEKIELLQAEIERLRAAIRSTVADGTYDEIAIRKAVSFELAELIVEARAALEQNVCPTCKKAESKFCSDAWHLVHS